MQINIVTKRILQYFKFKVCQIQNKSAIKSLNLFYYILVEHIVDLLIKHTLLDTCSAFMGRKKIKTMRIFKKFKISIFYKFYNFFDIYRNPKIFFLIFRIQRIKLSKLNNFRKKI